MNKIFLLLLFTSSAFAQSLSNHSIDAMGSYLETKIYSCEYKVQKNSSDDYELKLRTYDKDKKPVVEMVTAFNAQEFSTGVYRETRSYDLWYYFDQNKKLAGFSLSHRPGIFSYSKYLFHCLFSGDWNDLESFIENNYGE